MGQLYSKHLSGKTYSSANEEHWTHAKEKEQMMCSNSSFPRIYRHTGSVKRTRYKEDRYSRMLFLTPIGRDPP